MGKSLVTGIDIGHNSIKAVVLKLVGESYTLIGYQELPVDESMFSDNHTLDQQKIVKKLKLLKKSLPRFQRKVALSIPDSVVISKILQIDADLEEREKEFAIHQAFAHQSPFPIEELNLDFVKVGEKVTTSASTATYQVYASRKLVVASRVDAAKEAGLSPVVLDIQAHSLLRIWDGLVAKFPEHRSWLLVDIGLTQTGVCSMNFGSSPFFKEIAYGAKHRAMLANDANDADETEQGRGTHQFTNELASRLKRVIQMQSSLGDGSVKGIWLSGGGATIPNLAEELARQLGLECELINPFLLFNSKNSSSVRNIPDSHRFSTAAGLAISGLKWENSSHAT